mmetsp:Transcript_155895/g.275426  ORF Transcript_155895/g.275426 Transcript_155895/m.275426 type:complete len:291 (-) Transcript_155895:2300-3172(-)
MTGLHCCQCLQEAPADNQDSISSFNCRRNKLSSFAEHRMRFWTDGGGCGRLKFTLGLEVDAGWCLLLQRWHGRLKSCYCLLGRSACGLDLLQLSRIHLSTKFFTILVHFANLFKEFSCARAHQSQVCLQKLIGLIFATLDSEHDLERILSGSAQVPDSLRVLFESFFDVFLGLPCLLHVCQLSIPGCQCTSGFCQSFLNRCERRQAISFSFGFGLLQSFPRASDFCDDFATGPKSENLRQDVILNGSQINQALRLHEHLRFANGILLVLGEEMEFRRELFALGHFLIANE